ncbi:MAG: pyrroline-5-carboxylate reductase [Candidatus Binataceae bacterium]
MKKLGFIGGGNMAEALARGLLAKKLFSPSAMIVSDVDAGRRRKLSRALKIATTADNLEVLHGSRALLFAVKPQAIDEVLAEIGNALGGASAIADDNRKPVRRASAAADSKLFISIAAGITLSRLTAALGPRARVIRVMPNAPAMVGQGMAALVRAAGANNADEAFALKIFRAVGDAVALDDETRLDAVTALSGSGPAYVYLFVKAMADAGVSEGLTPELAVRMALKTIRGAEQNMRQSSLEPAELIRIVASPGGTTEAALRKFAEAGFSDIVADALHAAAERSRELGRT